jgi:hypothetical protein
MLLSIVVTPVVLAIAIAIAIVGAATAREGSPRCAAPTP